MANVLDMLGRAVLRIGGMSPQQIRQQTRANKAVKPLPKPSTARPPATPPPVTRRSRVNGRVVPGTDTRGNRPATPTRPPAPPRPPAPGSIQPTGQTNLFSQNGKPRNFTNPRVAANRPPTLSPIYQRGPQATPPRPPVDGFGAPAAPGQGFFDLGAGQRQGIPNPWGQSTSPNRALVQSTAQGRTAPSVPSRPPAGGGTARSGGGVFGGPVGVGQLAIAGLQIANGVQDQFLSPQALKNKRENEVIPPSLGGSIPNPLNGGGPQQGNHQSRFAGARDANLNRINSDPRFAAPAPRSPSSAPVHAAPAQLRAPAEQALAPAPVQPQPAPVQPSVYAPQAGQAQRPSTPAQAVQQQPQAPANPYAGVGDVRGQQLGSFQGGDTAAGTQEYGGQSVQGADQNSVDMERRRAFLDADNSLDGMKAVRELLKRRKLSISVSD
jgi:hypothetical protein